MQDNNAEKIDLTKYLDYFFRTVLKLKKLLILIIVIMIAIMEIRTVFFFETTYS